MILFKLGGSLLKNGKIHKCISEIIKLKKNSVIVLGGGIFTDTVRKQQKFFKFNDLYAHNMSILSMIQMTYLTQSFFKNKLKFFEEKRELKKIFYNKKIGVWHPYKEIKEKFDSFTNWKTTSDTLSLNLAKKLKISSIIIIKSSVIPKWAKFKSKSYLDLKVIKKLSNIGILDKNFYSFQKKNNLKVNVISFREIKKIKNYLTNC